VLGGNSQGGVVTTQAIPKIPKALEARVIAITMFGAPACLPEVKDKCRSYCNAGDDVSLAYLSSFSREKGIGMENGLLTCLIDRFALGQRTRKLQDDAIRPTTRSYGLFRGMQQKKLKSWRMCDHGRWKICLEI
jgi:hypothetical protein